RRVFGHVDDGGVHAVIVLPFPSQCRAGFVECRRVDVPQHDRRAGSEHALGNSEADAARAAGNDRGAVFQIDGVHGVKAFSSSLRGAKRRSNLGRSHRTWIAPLHFVTLAMTAPAERFASSAPLSPSGCGDSFGVEISLPRSSTMRRILATCSALLLASLPGPM